MSPLRLYLLAAVPFFVFFTGSIRGDNREGFLETMASVPLFAEGSQYLPHQGPIAPELANDSAARAAWQVEYDRIGEYNDSVRQVFSARYDRGVGRVFDLLPVAVGLVMVPLLALALSGSNRPRYVARLVFSFHVHIIAYVAWLLGAVVQQGWVTGPIGAVAYLAAARRRLFAEPWLASGFLACVTLVGYAISFFVCFVGMVQLLSVIAPGWTFGSTWTR